MTAVAAPARERPILFSGPMVRAILEGRKTQTRRVVKPGPSSGVRWSPFVSTGLEDGHGREIRIAYGQPGDRLWVRETWGYAPGTLNEERLCCYKATPEIAPFAWPARRGPIGDFVARWRPSIHMPRWASRLTLEITDVRVERLQQITAADAWQEGIRPVGVAEQAGDGASDIDPESAVVGEFIDLWNSLNAKRGFGWDANPWVWVLTFNRAADGR